MAVACFLGSRIHIVDERAKQLIRKSCKQLRRQKCIALARVTEEHKLKFGEERGEAGKVLKLEPVKKRTNRNLRP